MRGTRPRSGVHERDRCPEARRRPPSRARRRRRAGCRGFGSRGMRTRRPCPLACSVASGHGHALHATTDDLTRMVACVALCGRRGRARLDAMWQVEVPQIMARRDSRSSSLANA
eukprot:6190847-Pleurochrysis_carterae.AAC.1